MCALRPGRPRQFRLLLSDREWEKLVDLTDAEDASAADVVRGLIHRRHEDIFRAEGPDWLAAAEMLSALSRRVRALVEEPKPSVPAGKEGLRGGRARGVAQG